MIEDADDDDDDDGYDVMQEGVKAVVGVGVVVVEGEKLEECERSLNQRHLPLYVS